MDFKIVERNVINTTTIFLVNQGTLPQQVIDGMMSLVLSSDGCKIETSRLEQFVRFSSESLIACHKSTEYFNKFKQLPDKMKMRLATETRIIDIITLNANDRQKYLEDLRKVKCNGKNWKLNLRLIEMFNQVTETENTKDVELIEKEFWDEEDDDDCIEEDIEDTDEVDTHVSGALYGMVPFEIMKHYLRFNKLSQAKSLFERIE